MISDDAAAEAAGRLDRLRAEYAPSLLRSTAARVQMRVDAILERDKDQRIAIEGRGCAISFLFAKDILHALEAGHDEIERLQQELKIAKATTTRTSEMLDRVIMQLRQPK